MLKSAILKETAWSRLLIFICCYCRWFFCSVYSEFWLQFSWRMKLLLLQFDSSPTPSQVRSCAFNVSHPARVLAREIKPATQTTLANSQVVCLLSYGILNNVMFNLNYLFQLLARPTSLSTINNAEGKQRFFLFIYLFIYLLVTFFIFFFHI